MESIIFRWQDLTDPNSSVEWLSMDAQGRPQAASKTGGFKDLARQLHLSQNKRQAIMLLPSHTYSLFRVELPPKLNLANAKKAAPYKLEEELTENIENYHFAYGQLEKSESNTQLSVAAINKAKLHKIINTLAEHNITIKYAYPETCLLPQHVANTQAIYIENQTVHTRINAHTIYSLPADLLDSVIATIEADAIELFIPDNYLVTNTLPEHVSSKPYHGNLLNIYAKELSQSSPLNILQGEFRQQQAITQQLKIWSTPAAIAALVCIIALATNILSNQQLEKQISELEEQKIEIFKQAFPNSRRFHRVRQRMEQAIQSNQSSGESSDFLPLLKEYVEANSLNAATEINAIEYNRNKLSFTINAQDIQVLDKIKVDLEKDQQVVASIGSSKSIATGIEATLNLEKP